MVCAGEHQGFDDLMQEFSKDIKLAFYGLLSEFVTLSSNIYNKITG
jgi:hypothetical protein